MNSELQELWEENYDEYAQDMVDCQESAQYSDEESFREAVWAHMVMLYEEEQSK